MPSTSLLRRPGGRARVLLAFAAFGTFWGTWGAVVPAVQARAGATDGELGFALLCIALGALVSLRLTGRLVDRHGDRVTAVAVLGFAGATVAPGLATSPGWLALSLALVGAMSGAMDVAINTEAVQEEDRRSRPLTNLAAAGFSAAVVASSLAAGGLRAAGAGVPVILALVAGLLVAVGLGLRRGTTRPAGARSPAPQAARPAAWLLRLGGLCALAFFVENAWQSWSAVHLEDTLGASAGAGALGPAAFASAAAAGRLAGNGLLRHVSHRALIGAGAALAALGTLAAATAQSVPVAVAGILTAGLGSSVCAPTLFSLAGRRAAPRERGGAISTVTALGYLGFLLGPACVGGLAQARSLPFALTAVAAVAVVLAFGALLGPAEEE